MPHNNTDALSLRPEVLTRPKLEGGRKFVLNTPFTAAGDQPTAIAELTRGVLAGDHDQVLLGATGTGKTFTMAKVIEETQRPAIILAPNKTLAAQLYGEFKGFFPNNAVEYFISYYDYYQPEAFIASTNTYIEKDLAINSEIEKLRLSTVSTLMSGRRDIVVVASVSCIYGAGNPEEYKKSILRLQRGETTARNKLLFSLVDILYSRTEGEFSRGTFRVKGDTVDVFPAYADFAYRIIFFGDEIETLQRIDPQSGKKLADLPAISIFPANLFVTGRDTLNAAMHQIQDDMVAQVKFFEHDMRLEEATRIRERTELTWR